MGLELVEFVVAIEETFGLTMPDEPAAKIRTPQDLIDYLVANVPKASGPQACLTTKAFLRLRRAIIDILKLPRERVRPSARWADLLPPKSPSRRAVWRSMRRQLALPRMRFGRSASVAFVLAALACGLGAAFAMFGIRLIVAPVGLLLGLLVWVGLLVTFHNYASNPPEATIGESARQLSLRQAASFKEEGAGWTRDEVTRIVHEIMKVQLQVTGVSDSTRFVDMGLP